MCKCVIFEDPFQGGKTSQKERCQSQNSEYLMLTGVAYIQKHKFKRRNIKPPDGKQVGTNGPNFISKW
jgi:hypothetical protein